MRRHPILVERTSEAITSASSSVSEKDIRGWFSEILQYVQDNDLQEVLSDLKV